MRTIAVIAGFLLTVSAQAQSPGPPPAGPERRIAFGNSRVRRTFQIGVTGFGTVEYRHLTADLDNCDSPCDEFALTVNGTEVTGRIGASAFQFKRQIRHNTAGEQKLTVVLDGVAGTVAENLEVELDYAIYGELAVIRKQLSVTNRSRVPVTLTDVDVERLNLLPGSEFPGELVSNSGTTITPIPVPYVGTPYDPLLMVWNSQLKEGLMLGNEAFGVLKRTAIYSAPERIDLGLTRADSRHPFKKVLAPGESFAAPRTFIGFYHGAKWQDAFEGDYADFVREHLGVRRFEKAGLRSYYNTWELPGTGPGMGSMINEQLIRETADAASAAGFGIFTIDTGWQTGWGDWRTNLKKFPHGLAPVCDYIRARGMQPGLWISLATIFGDSPVALQHPEWTIKGRDGKPTNIHGGPWENHELVTMSLCTPWFDWCLGTIKALVRENGLKYLKLDLGVESSPYIADPALTGDYEAKPGYYADRTASHYALLQRTQDLLDELHRVFPDVILDCTYEVMGVDHLSDFATLEHADVDWISNYSALPPEGALSIRQLAYDRSRVIPPATLILGNPPIQAPLGRSGFFSTAAAAPLMMGDPRQLPASELAWYRHWIEWFGAMENRFQFSRYYQVSDVFDRPSDSNWDGCYKFNRQKGGGVLFFFRNRSPDGERRFRVHCVDPAKTYRVSSADPLAGTGTFSGAELASAGLKVTIPEPNTAAVFGIEEVASGSR